MNNFIIEKYKIFKTLLSAIPAIIFLFMAMAIEVCFEKIVPLSHKMFVIFARGFFTTLNSKNDKDFAMRYKLFCTYKDLMSDFFCCEMTEVSNIIKKQSLCEFAYYSCLIDRIEFGEDFVKYLIEIELCNNVIKLSDRVKTPNT